MLQCLEIWLIVLAGLSCKPDVLSSDIDTDKYYETSLKRGIGREKQRFTVSQRKRKEKIKCRVIPLPAKWGTLSHPKINKADVVLATHTTDTG